LEVEQISETLVEVRNLAAQMNVHFFGWHGIQIDEGSSPVDGKESQRSNYDGSDSKHTGIVSNSAAAFLFGGKKNTVNKKKRGKRKRKAELTSNMAAVKLIRERKKIMTSTKMRATP
jgi:5'-3' exonuclease